MSAPAPKQVTREEKVRYMEAEDRLEDALEALWEKTEQLADPELTERVEALEKAITDLDNAGGEALDLPELPEDVEALIGSAQE